MAIFLEPDEFLTYQDLASGKYTEKERRELYSRLRSVSQKRLQRMKGTVWSRTLTYKQNKDLYKPLKEIKTISELNTRLAKLTRFISAETGTIKGLKAQRAKSIAALKSHEFTGINEENWFDFTDFMEEMKADYEGEIYVSDKWVDRFREIDELRNELSVENIDVSFKEVQDNFKKYQKKLAKLRENN